MLLIKKIPGVYIEMHVWNPFSSNDIGVSFDEASYNIGSFRQIIFRREDIIPEAFGIEDFL